MKHFLTYSIVHTARFTHINPFYVATWLFFFLWPSLVLAETTSSQEPVSVEQLGPVLEKKTYIHITPFEQTIQNMPAPWSPSIVPILEENMINQYESSIELSDDLETDIIIPEIEPSEIEAVDVIEFEVEAESVMLDSEESEFAENDATLDVIDTSKEPSDALLVEDSDSSSRIVPAEIMPMDVHPKPAQIAILIDDLGYNRHGMESSLILPTEVALAILPETPFALKTAEASQQQKRITLLHAPMENQRGLNLGPGGLYAKMTEEELKETLQKDIDGLPGIQGVNNHMGSLLTTKQQHMTWVMEVLQERSLFFIDSLTSRDSVAKETAQQHGLKTVSREVFLDNIRTEKAIDTQFSRLIKLARKDGSALAIGHPYAETTAYLKKRLSLLAEDGVILVPLSNLLQPANDQQN